eukprot:5116916-Pyramimonas_sp.AAC.1
MKTNSCREPSGRNWGSGKRVDGNIADASAVCIGRAQFPPFWARRRVRQEPLAITVGPRPGGPLGRGARPAQARDRPKRAKEGKDEIWLLELM